MKTHRRAGCCSLPTILPLWLVALGVCAQEVRPDTARPPRTSVIPKISAPFPISTKMYVRYPWRTGIVTTLFWVGEPTSGKSGERNSSSAWDVAWQTNFGGVDDPEPTKRTTNYIPSAFVPKLNPFYIALPYSDVVDSSTTKEGAARIIPWFKQVFTKPGQSVCRNRWVAVRLGSRVCYAQWSDSGPFGEDDAAYVFGGKRPANVKNGGVGLNVSPAVRDYLGLASGATCDWRFVELIEVPPGPWRTYGSNNPFIRSKADQRDDLKGRLEELRKMRDEYFRANGGAGAPAK